MLCSLGMLVFASHIFLGWVCLCLPSMNVFARHVLRFDACHLMFVCLPACHLVLRLLACRACAALACLSRFFVFDCLSHACVGLLVMLVLH